MRTTLVFVLAAVACRPSTSSSPFSYVRPPPGGDTRAGLGTLGARLDAALQRSYHAQLAEARAPFELVPGDGSALALQRLEATVAIDGPLARTELRFTFKNTEERTREGRFSITLPPGAAVGGFGMKVGDRWRRARIVSRERGREVYEQFLRRGVDPALLEQDVGERFSARVFPIAPHEDKQIEIAYDHVVDEHHPYTLALAGLPRIPALAIRIDHDGTRTARTQQDAAPADVVVPIASGSAGVAAGKAFVARIEPDAFAPAVPAPIERVLIAVDTSASRAPVMGRQADVVRRIVGALPPAATVSLAAFDHDVTELFRGPARDAGAATLRLYEHGALGASNLGGLLSHAVTSGLDRLVIVGDGVATAGTADAAELAAIVKDGAIERVDLVKVGDGLDRDAVAAIVAAGRHPGAILDGRDPERVAIQLATAPAGELPIRVAGASRTWPATTRDTAPGDPIWVYGLRDGGGSLEVAIGPRTVRVAPARGDVRHTRRTVARAELATLTAAAARAPVADRGKLYDAIETLALAHELVSPRTSFIVFENDADELGALGQRRPGRDAGPAPARSDDVSKWMSPGDRGAEAIQIMDTAPTIDPTSTAQGITIDRGYVANLPIPGRTFEAVLGAAPGAQADRYGVGFSGSTALENTYVVDGINTTPLGPAGRRAHNLAGRGASGAAGIAGGGFGWVPRASDWQGDPDRVPPPPPYTGKLAGVMAAIAKTHTDDALAQAAAWQLASPGDLAAILALGEALEARGATVLATRAYGSIADLYPGRAELVRGCAERLDRIPAARSLAIDLYRRALRDRPDHASTYRLLAYALVRAGQLDEALTTLATGLAKAHDGVVGVLLQDARVIGAAIVAREPRRLAEVTRKLGVAPATRPSLHVVLSWETDANDVDLHVRDARNDHAYYASRQLASGGELMHDITDGYGPEMFSVEFSPSAGRTPDGFPYKLAAHYYRRGPMGIGLGTAQIIRHDGKGGLAIEDRPFAIQNDDAMIELGAICETTCAATPPRFSRP